MNPYTGLDKIYVYKNSDITIHTLIVLDPNDLIITSLIHKKKIFNYYFREINF